MLNKKTKIQNSKLFNKSKKGIKKNKKSGKIQKSEKIAKNPKVIFLSTNLKKKKNCPKKIYIYAILLVLQY